MRTREHIVEEESRRAFKAAFPPAWVVRDQVPDYGLDFQVEPFENERGLNTPFYAQLKATDSDLVNVQLQTARLIQYQEAAHPVLVVLYQSKNRSLRCEWAHRITARLTAKSSWWRFQKTVTVELPTPLSEGSAAVVLEGVRQFYRMRGGPARSPALRLRLELPSPTSALSMAVADAIAALLAVTGGRVLLGDPKAEVQIVVNGDWSKVRLRYQSLDVELSTLLPGSPKVDDAAAVVQLVSAIAVSLGGLAFDAGRMLHKTIEAYGTANGALQHLLNLDEPWRVLVSAGAYNTAFDLADVLLQRGLDRQAFMAAQAGSAALHSRPTNDHYAGEQRYRTILYALLKGASNDSVRAFLHYNAATSLRYSGLGVEAVDHYRHAAMANPAYLESASWWSGMGGALFMRNCLRLSRACYQHATEITDDRLPKGLLADIHFRLRDFERASDLFAEWFKMNSELDAGLLLKHSVVPLLAQEFGSGLREIHNAYGVAVEAYNQTNLDRRYEGLAKALRLDPLCEFAWFNYATHRALAEPKAAAQWWLVAATLTWRWDVQAIVNAVVALTHEKEIGAAFALVALLFLAGRQHGEAFYVEVERRVRSTSPEHSVSEFIKRLRDLTTLGDEMFGRAWTRRW